MKRINIKPIAGFSGFLIKCLGVLMGVKWGHLLGWASAWDTVYIIPSQKGNSKLIAHELKHIEQMDNIGKLKFMVLCTFENISVGYSLNKYEVEARKAFITDFKDKYFIDYKF